MRRHFVLLFIAFFSIAALSSCEQAADPENTSSKQSENPREVSTADGPELIILGTIQDAGSPQIGCEKECCSGLFEHPDPNRMVVALGLADGKGKTYLFEATPDLPRQVNILQKWGGSTKKVPDGIFLTHAHIGHYTGLMYLGKESSDASSVPVFAMPRMTEFLSNNGPWNLLVERNNIALTGINEKVRLALGDITIIPILVPHRDEFSETVGYRIEGPNQSALFIPDIDKWSKWENDIAAEIAKVDYAFLDATFFSGEEINNRDISQIPHPFVIESLEAFKDLKSSEKSKIHFIHFNHTNPIIDVKSKEAMQVIDAGFNIAQLNATFSL